MGGGDLWVTKFILKYDGKPSYTVSIMEFRGDKVARETQYFADPFVAPSSRSMGRTDGHIISRRESSLTTRPFAVYIIIVENQRLTPETR